MNTLRFWKQTCCKIRSRYHICYTSLAPVRSSIIKPLVAGPGNWYVGEACIGGETVTVQAQSALDNRDLEELCHGGFPANCEGEEIQLGKLSQGTFSRIRAAFEARIKTREEPIRSYVTYNARFSTASALKSPPTEVHVSAVEEIRRQMMDSIQEALPLTAKHFFRFRTETGESAFDSESESMIKVPDALLQYRTGRHDIYRKNIFVLQVGFRESYNSLKNSMDLWLDGNEYVKAALLVKFTEKPQYRTPIDIDNPPVNFQEDAQLRIATVEPKLVEDFGRISIHGKVFAHRMTGFCELWLRNPDTGKPELQGSRIDFYNSDTSVEIEPAPLKIDFDTYFPDLQELRGKTFVVDWREGAKEALIIIAKQDLSISKLAGAIRLHGLMIKLLSTRSGYYYLRLNQNRN